MSDCDQARQQFAYLLDGELQGAELEEFETHLAGCTSCRQALDEERDFIDIVRSAKPTHRLPDGLRTRLNDRLQSENLPRPHVGTLLRPRVVVAALLVIIAVAFSIYRLQTASAADFERFASETHLKRLSGQLPMEISSESPQAVSDWYIGKVPFRLSLPNYQTDPGEQKPYELQGARLVEFRNEFAAYIGYAMGGRPISLIVTTEQLATPRGGEEIKSHGLTFHFRTVQGLKVLTWEDKGLTYAQVSDLEGRGQQSCIICHPGPSNRHLFDELKDKGN
ncbi:MAG: zf-HC2 domain-containing protein [Acidobacteriia bacterium]|nr:zf-HC2 domain-containing protein [Terriglobia bacterium]